MAGYLGLLQALAGDSLGLSGAGCSKREANLAIAGAFSFRGLGRGDFLSSTSSDVYFFVSSDTD